MNHSNGRKASQTNRKAGLLTRPFRHILQRELNLFSSPAKDHRQHVMSMPDGWFAASHQYWLHQDVRRGRVAQMQNWRRGTKFGRAIVQEFERSGLFERCCGRGRSSSGIWETSPGFDSSLGRRRTNSEPSLTLLATVTLPPWAWTTALTRLKPSPKPRCERLLSPRY